MAELTREQVEQTVKETRKKGRKPSLRWRDLSSIDLGGVDLSGAYLTHANFHLANLSGANLSGANLGGAYLNRANLNGANLSGANLGGANLSGADLRWAILSGTNFFETNLSGAVIGFTIFGDVDLSEVKGLDIVNHQALSTIGIDTIYKSKGNISPKFLEKAGVPDAIIKWHTNLKNLPTVFICSSHKDREDKDKLVSHLRVVGQEDLFTIWDYDDPEKVPAGSEWKKEIKDGLTQAKIAILFISKDLLTSEHFNKLELPMLLERQKGEDFTIFPVIAKDCAWRAADWLKRLEVRPKSGKPIWSNGGNVDSELAKITEEVEKIIKRL